MRGCVYLCTCSGDTTQLLFDVVDCCLCFVYSFHFFFFKEKKNLNNVCFYYDRIMRGDRKCRGERDGMGWDGIRAAQTVRMMAIGAHCPNRWNQM